MKNPDRQKKVVLFALLLSAPFALTSCRVHFFAKNYDVPWPVVAVPVAVFTIAAMLIAGKVISSKEYVCPRCGKSFRPGFFPACVSIHIGDARLFRCPHCGERDFCSPTRE